MKTISKNIIGITMGDPAGIGPEIIAKSLAIPAIRKLANYLIIGDYSIYSKYALGDYKNCSFLDINSININKIKIGKESTLAGKASFTYLQTAVEFLRKNKISSLVTAPLSKESICKSNPGFTGHTEFLAKAFKVKEEGMLFVTNKIKVLIVTRHIPIKNVSKHITKEKVYNSITLTNNTLKDIFKIRKPKIAVCGLNPHAGEGGNIGTEEQAIIIPAIKKARKKNINAIGPLPADTVFAMDTYTKFDAIIAMYHDQGLVGIKTICFSELVNMTIGLPFIRTSPAHGTAFNIAGKNIANPSSMCEAIKLAAQLGIKKK